MIEGYGPFISVPADSATPNIISQGCGKSVGERVCAVSGGEVSPGIIKQRLKGQGALRRALRASCRKRVGLLHQTGHPLRAGTTAGVDSGGCERRPRLVPGLPRFTRQPLFCGGEDERHATLADDRVARAIQVADQRSGSPDGTAHFAAGIVRCPCLVPIRGTRQGSRLLCRYVRSSTSDI